MLDARKKAILYVAVQEYILTAEPVSSQKLVEKYQLGVSSATVRNELATLEALGYLHQPHTSAGRIPTDMGYRYYVDGITDKPGLTHQEENSIVKLFSSINMEMEELMKETTHILSNVTSYIAVALAPSFKKSMLKHIDLVSLSPRHVLVVLITDKGQVLKRTVSMEPYSGEIGEIERFLNEKLQGLDSIGISALRDTLILPDPDASRTASTLINAILDIIESDERERVFLSGTAGIYGQPEFEELSKVHSLLNAIEQGYRLMQWLEDSVMTRKVLVRIGSENTDDDMRGCSIITSNYQLDSETRGTLGIIGPTRMNYSRAISVVELISDKLSKALVELRS
ncbi:MAG: heat-inducible transcriptional repressor HrcA [Actinomycetota bacterium]|nr:heat-inducible transcriptional repressor HrcA [Actinomycetota bacterium]